MTKLMLLLKLNFLSFFGINKFLKSKNSEDKTKMKRQIYLLIIGFGAIIYFSYYYSVMMMNSFVLFKAEHLLLPVFMVVTSIFILTATINKVSNYLFNFSDYDMVISLPIKTNIIVLSRLLSLYFMNLIYTLLFMLPAGFVYSFVVRPDILFYPIFIVTLLLIPLIPMIIATIVGSIITLISSYFKKNNLFHTIFTVVIFIIFMYLMMFMNGDTNYFDLVSTMLNKLKTIYPLVTIYQSSVIDFNILSLLEFSGISLILFSVFIYFISCFFKKINTLVTTKRTVSKYKMQKLKRSKVGWTLLKRDFKRYFSSSVYVLNTSIGLVLSIIACIFLLIFGSKDLEAILQFDQLSDMLSNYAPLILAIFVCLSCSTACSVSIEGKNFWIIKSLPLSEKRILLSKVLLNVILCSVMIIINGTILNILLRPKLVIIISMYLIPFLYAWIISFIGIFLNLYNPNFDWKSEVTVVKQSMPVLLIVFIGMFISILPLIIISNINLNISLLFLIIILILLIINIVLFQTMNKKGASMLKKM